MSERNSKLKQLEKQIKQYAKDQEYLIEAIKIKDRMLVEFAVCLTAQKIPIPMHVLKIMNTLYPDKMQAIEQIEKEFDNVEAVENAKSEKQKIKNGNFKIVE